MDDILKKEEREALEGLHRKERDGPVRDRIKAVLLRDDGWTDELIAQALRISRTSVATHIEEYQREQKLKPANGGSSAKLNGTQERELEEHLQEKTYLYAKDVAAYVAQQYGIKYTVSGMTYWLERHGFTHHKPAVRPGKVDPVAQEEFIRKYNDLLNNLPDDEEVVFVDGVHPSHNTHVAAGWIKKGVRKEICTNSGRKRLNLLGSIRACLETLHRRENFIYSF
jgi:transposase